MREILIFAGTTEGRMLSEHLAAAEIAHTVCVATEYGEIVLKEHPFVRVHCGRMDCDEIRAYIKAGGFAAVVDATHPYAKVVTENIKAAMEDMDIPYLRLKREIDAACDYKNIVYFKNSETCAAALQQVEGNILLTTGSKELSVYCTSPEVKSRLYVRVLPGMESLKLCIEQGISGKQILALQGPFSIEMNEAMLRQYHIRCLVTKESGKNGGYQEKIEAARHIGIPVYVIGRTKEDGLSFDDVCHRLEIICSRTIQLKKSMEIILAGVGMGSIESLTREVYQAIMQADILFGAHRMIEAYQPRLEKKAYYMADQIIPYLKDIQEKVLLPDGGKVVVLFSGDSGFFSGCQAMNQALQKEIAVGELTASVRILPGISSVAYLASCIGESYQDAAICSMHGKELPNLARKIAEEEKTFLLMSGVKDINRLGRMLMDAGLEKCEILAGYRLSYPEQRILSLTPQKCLEIEEEGLYTCCIKNPHVIPKRLTHGVGDEIFIRGRVPMTKEEVREVSICKLKLHQGAVVYDIGSGTGSIAVEIAGLSENVRVFAIEKKEEAVSLITQNMEKAGLENIRVIPENAPEGLMELPQPTHAFIGGSGGNLKEIMNVLYQKNPYMRIVVNAVSVETICEINEVLSLYPVKNEEIVQMQVSRAKSAGNYHLMQAENPVWICAFEFCGQGGKERA